MTSKDGDETSPAMPPLPPMPAVDQTMCDPFVEALCGNPNAAANVTAARGGGSVNQPHAVVEFEDEGERRREGKMARRYSVGRQYHSKSGAEYELLQIRWALLFVIAYTGLTNNMLFNGFGGIITEAADYFDVETFEINQCVAIGYFLIFFANFPAMWLVDKLGIYWGFFVGVVVNVAGAWIRHIGGQMANESGFYVLLGGQVLVSVASPFVTSLPAPLASRWFAPDEQAMVNALGGLTQFLGLGAGLFMGMAFKDNIGLYILVQAILMSTQLAGIFVVRDRPPVPPGPSAKPIPFELVKATKILFSNKNSRRLLLGLGFIVIPISTYFSLMEVVIPPSAKSGMATIAALIVGSGLVSAVIVAALMDTTHAYIQIMRTLCTLGLLNFVIMGFAWYYDHMYLVWFSSITLGWLGMPFVPLSIELNIEYSYTPGFNLEATITGYVVVVTNFFSFVGLYCTDPDITGLPIKYLGFLWMAIGWVGIGFLFTAQPEYNRQAFVNTDGGKIGSPNSPKGSPAFTSISGTPC